MAQPLRRLSAAHAAPVARVPLAWPALAGLWLLAAGLVGAVGGWWRPENPALIAWDWQPALALSQPWRAWTAALLHLSTRHLAMNALGLALLAWLGWRAGAGARATAAWALAWPLTQLGLLAQPGLAHYVGLSGVGHAGVAILVGVIARDGGAHRWPAGLLGGGLLLKLLLEQPWQAPLQAVPGWDFPLAPGAHASGALAGALCALALGAWRRP